MNFEWEETLSWTWICAWTPPGRRRRDHSWTSLKVMQQSLKWEGIQTEEAMFAPNSV
jgi:hypothetical protein